MNLEIDQSFPHFDQPVPKNGYVWWYVDAVSDDGEQALTLIAFIGSVFSPYYAWARERGPTEPLEHCALNVAIYNRRGKKWAMTERPSAAVSRTPHNLAIGPSSVNWDGNSLNFSIEELTMPIPSRIRGQVKLWPTVVTDHKFVLDEHGFHHWHPIAPSARIEVSFYHPKLNWSGNAYWDSNWGARPLEEDFISWDWSRANHSGGTSILYEGLRRPHNKFSLALNIDSDGKLETFSPPELTRLANTRWWRIARSTRTDGGQAQVLDTLEDTPFYSRSLLRTSLSGKPLTAVHESLSLERFSSRWVQCLLPFRMPRTRR